MTPRRGPMSEDEKVIVFCLLFPIFWPLIPVILVCMAARGMRNTYYDWRYRRRAKLDGEE